MSQQAVGTYGKDQACGFSLIKNCFSWGAMWFEELENKIRSPLKH